jgi:hypothetical protein
MRRQFSLFPFIGLITLFFVSCAGGDRIPLQEQDTPSYGTYPYSGSNIGRQQYGPQDRAGNPTQNSVPPYAGCQYATRC